jgi:monoamine oxidase
MEHRQADVCVVGAGFAGLAAARLLINEAHKTVVVLEARDRADQRFHPLLPLAEPRTADRNDGAVLRGLIADASSHPNAMAMSRMEAETRKLTCLTEIASRLGDEAMFPVGYVETDWSSEHWSQGGMIGRFPTGVLTSYGSALHDSVGRIHFAGTERATLFHGLMEGAVRSGEETARLVVKRLDREANVERI